MHGLCIPVDSFDLRCESVTLLYVIMIATYIFNYTRCILQHNIIAIHLNFTVFIAFINIISNSKYCSAKIVHFLK